MSKFKIIAVAVAAALAAPAAFATSVTVQGNSPELLPSNAFINGTINAVNFTKTLTVAANATSVYLGRQTGYQIRLTLSQGLFNGTPAAAPTGGTQTVSVAGGGNDFNTVSYAVTPAVGGVVSGAGIQFAAGGITVDGVAALGTGGTISVKVQVFDPIGGGQLGPDIDATLIRTIQGWAISYAAGDSTQRIDVGSASAKRFFGNETVGSGLAATPFNAGLVNIAIEPTLTNQMGLNVNTAEAPVNIFGTDFSAFKLTGAVYLATSSACPTAASIPALVATNSLSASIPAATKVVAVNNAPWICFNGNDTQAIAAQVISSSVAVPQTTFIASPLVTSTPTQLTAMSFNGSVVTLANFNPGSNTVAESYLRITNGSATSGLVTINGVCDDGAATPTNATFQLLAGNSRLITAKTLEAGTGLTTGTGTCASPGKTRLTVTGEFSSMAVQNFIRNVNSSGIVNSNVNNQN